jgi:hypothetical protein
MTWEGSVLKGYFYIKSYTGLRALNQPGGSAGARARCALGQVGSTGVLFVYRYKTVLFVIN